MSHGERVTREPRQIFFLQEIEDMAPAAISWYCFTQEEKNDLEHSWNLVEAKKNNIACDIYEMIFNQVRPVTVLPSTPIV